MNHHLLKGKELKEGMTVIVASARRWSELKTGGTPITVVSIEYPFVVFEVVHFERTLPDFAAFVATISSGDKPKTGIRTVRDTFAASVKWCRFRQVSEEYIEAYLRPTTPYGEPDWLKEKE